MTRADLIATARLVAADCVARPEALRAAYEALARAGHHWAAGALLEDNRHIPGVVSALAYHGMSRHADAIAALREGEAPP